MRLDEITTVSDVLKGSQYIRLLKNLKRRAGSGINVTRIKNQIIRSWKSGLKSRKHFGSLLKEYDISIDELVEE